MKNRLLSSIPCFIALLSLGSKANAQTTNRSPKLIIGAYYFDGWTGKTFHISKKLRDTFPERQPIWGWVTSTPPIMQRQIDYAADAGISFFSFCWFYTGIKYNQQDPKDNALKLYLSAANHSRLSFNILVVNHEGYTIGPNQWDNLIKLWVPLIKNPSYLKVDSRPLISFFSIARLVKEFGSQQAVKAAFNRLRDSARANNIPQIMIGACVDPSPGSIAWAKGCGVDLITGYSLAGKGFHAKEDIEPIDTLTNLEPALWNKLAISGMPVIPVSTLNFDPRPWGDVVPGYAHPQRYTGFSAQSVYNSISTLKKWLLNNNTNTKDKIGVVYAWNENGEGAWLTPTGSLQNQLLESFKRALSTH